MEYIIEIGAFLVASALAMILHELPKSIMYVLTGRHCKAEDKWRIFKLHQYIDPIGLILFLTCRAGCSRPYPYRLKEKDTNIAIGLTGFLTLVIMLMGSCTFYHFILGYLPAVIASDAITFGIKTLWFFMYASAALLIVNLFPMVSSDIFLLIIAAAPSTLIPLMKNDALIKGILLICIILGVISTAAVWIVTFFC